MHKSTYYGLLSSSIALLALLLCAVSGYAETANSDEALQVGRNWLSYIVSQKGSWSGTTKPEIIDYDEITAGDTVLATVFNVSPRGYIVVPVLKNLHPVKAYSDECNLDLTEPDGMALMLKEVLQHHVGSFADIYGSLEAVPSDQDPVLLAPHHRREWDKFAVSDEIFQAELASKSFQAMEDLGPLLTSSWHQSAPYNNFCPPGDGGRCVVGCVATATSQIMKYHQWPPDGVGEMTYYWYGDQSCGGTSPAMFLTAYLSDPYDWDNIGDYCGTGDPQEKQDAIAELCYEVGVALRMHYGVCGSGAYHFNVPGVFTDQFRFYDGITEEDRARHSYSSWSTLLKGQIEQGLPFQYGIYSHSIVGDGWRQTDSATQVHFNYGWGGSHNMWYTIDDLYCPWDGCSSMVESAIINIIPDKRVYFRADTLWGKVPLPVSFTGFSELQVDKWIYDFGNGDSSTEQSPNYVYNTPGRFDINLAVTAGGDTCNYMTTQYITALADSLVGNHVMGNPGETIEVVIHGRNTVPLEMLRIPVVYSGSMNLTYQSFSTEGCRTDYFDQQKLVSFDPMNKNITFSLLNYELDTPFLDPGAGPVLKIYFTISGSATFEQSANISMAGYGNYEPTFFGPILNYSPDHTNGVVTLYYKCGDADGNDALNILDVTYIISYLYKNGPPPIPEAAGDVDKSQSCNVLDISYLINYLYKGGPPPICE